MRVLSCPQAQRRSSAGGSMRTSRTGRSLCVGFCEGRTRLGRGVEGVASPSAVSRASSAWAATSCSRPSRRGARAGWGGASPSSCRTSGGRAGRRAGAARRSRPKDAGSRRNVPRGRARPPLADRARRRGRAHARAAERGPRRAREGARPASSRQESTTSPRGSEESSSRHAPACAGIPSSRVRHRAVERSRPSSIA